MSNTKIVQVKDLVEGDVLVAADGWVADIDKIEPINDKLVQLYVADMMSKRTAKFKLNQSVRIMQQEYAVIDNHGGLSPEWR